ncbi:hypothetical protein [Natrinema sp. 1APR25-10V2]|uniref:hypothetical protein n=1 Tax=Natrinema sp. 1APR25-10V2 TaxID=2951081 RepID=UPI002875A125|nr:hypothetical protein [Natrinema sp. 1APR25-10V2]MDS0475798.1 hypothetical protein [Natrinema sp. 1APR25-10V2]
MDDRDAGREPRIRVPPGVIAERPCVTSATATTIAKRYDNHPVRTVTTKVATVTTPDSFAAASVKRLIAAYVTRYSSGATGNRYTPYRHDGFEGEAVAEVEDRDMRNPLLIARTDIIS